MNKENIIKKLNEYIKLESDKYFREEALSLLRENNLNKIEERFYKNLEFGTAGIRGFIGAGFSFINTYNVEKTTQGIANYLLKNAQNSQIKVAISYDSRHFSKDFAYKTALVFTANGIKAYIYKNLRSTPQLSFTIRHFNCDFGIMITASHNPKEYNGYKAYLSGGFQIIPPFDEVIIKEIFKSREIKRISLSEAREKNLIVELEEEVDLIYINSLSHYIKNFSNKHFKTPLKVAYTPLNGTGITIIEKLLRHDYVELFIEREQRDPNPNFTTCPIPNPEESAALEKVLELAKERGCDIAFATDPDSDRLGVISLKKNGEWQILNGNEIAVLILKYLLDKVESPKNFYVISSFVSSPLIEKITQRYKAEFIKTYTGFKWIGSLIDKRQKEAYFKKFLFAAEESFGYLIGEDVKDKDAFSAIKVLILLVKELKANNTYIEDFLENIYREYGYHRELNFNKSFIGQKGEVESEEFMKKLRESEVKEFAGFKVKVKRDYLSLKERRGEEVFDIKEYKYKSNAIEFILENDIIIIARPSGTEPKIKIYLMLSLKYEERNKALNILNNIKKEIEAY